MFKAFIFFDAILVAIGSMYLALQDKMLDAIYFILLSVTLMVIGHVLSYWQSKSRDKWP